MSGWIQAAMQQNTISNVKWIDHLKACPTKIKIKNSILNAVVHTDLSLKTREFRLNMLHILEYHIAFNNVPTWMMSPLE